MSRIRSVHPGQWTDEDYVACGFAARLLAIGLRNEADDNGIFEWKPLGLKMKLFAADSVDVAELLAELVETNQVRQFEAGGRTYGAIRNFRVYQSPRSPKAVHPCPAEINEFLGAATIDADEAGPETKRRGPGRPRKAQNAETDNGDDAEFQHDAENNPPPGKSFPQNAENNPVMEREEEEELIVGGHARASARDADPPLPTNLIALTTEVCRAAGIRHADPGPIIRHQKLVQGWLDDGFDPETDILPGIRAGIATATERINSLSYFDRDIRQTRARREAGHEHPRDDIPTNPLLAALVAQDRAAGGGGGDADPTSLPRRAKA